MGSLLEELARREAAARERVEAIRKRGLRHRARLAESPWSSPVTRTVSTSSSPPA